MLNDPAMFTLDFIDNMSIDPHFMGSRWLCYWIPAQTAFADFNFMRIVTGIKADTRKEFMGGAKITESILTLQE